jgi:hypothetical protein
MNVCHAIACIGFALVTMAGCGAAPRPALLAVEPATPSREAWVPPNEFEMSVANPAERAPVEKKEMAMRPTLVTARKVVGAGGD